MTEQQPYPPQPYPPAPQPQPKKRKWPWVVAGIVGVLFVASLAGGNDKPNTPAAPKTNSAPAIVAGSSTAATPTRNAAPAVKVDPLVTNGTWLVGSEIKPGTYRSQVASNWSGSGYWEVCSDAACRVGDGLIQNGNGGDLIEVPATAYAVKLKGLVLTPIG